MSLSDKMFEARKQEIRMKSARYIVGSINGKLGRYSQLTHAMNDITEYYANEIGLYLEDTSPVLEGWPVLWVMGPDGKLECKTRNS